MARTKACIVPAGARCPSLSPLSSSPYLWERELPWWKDDLERDIDFADSEVSAESSVPTAAAAEGARARACASADADARSTTTTVTLSRLPRSTAARVSTVAAMRAALCLEAPR